MEKEITADTIGTVLSVRARTHLPPAALPRGHQEERDREHP